ncbi:hypothetical protein [Marinitoga sp. 1155]|uniref:hypothetical protein n=1 Tax=Marinitoga sp. 1155 TaxID=1428448 RepID=UPI00064121FB|nr:hypothetical protein [Marinitoga sp. 1155]AJW76984.1 hypothetical protein UF09_18 [Marinitoga camini virus 2]KLO24809.1 hypothetical protein X274_02345 [Marinitoga sp. 1155]
MFVFTDEAGDDGLKSQDKFKIVVFSHFFSKDDINYTLESFKVLSLNYFGNSLRSWKKQRGKIKKNPILIKKFINDFYKKTEKKFFLSIGIIEKDKKYYVHTEDIKNETVEIYSNLFKRGIPFYKRFYYKLGGYKKNGKPKIHWYIDKNEDELFIIPLKEKIKEYSEINNVELNGPKFLSKPKYLNGENKVFSQVIEMTDNFSGIILRSFREKTLEYEDLTRLILTRAKGFRISFNNNDFWKWDNVMISPMNYKSKYKYLIGNDYYTNFDKLDGEQF